MSPTEDEQRKKRSRIALSCDNCRKRKTKCDRKLPCGQCTKLSIPHLCVFSSPKHLNNKLHLDPGDESALQDELNTLKQQMKKLESTLTGKTEVEEPNLEPNLSYIADLIKVNKDLWLGENPSPDLFTNFYSSTNPNKECRPSAGPFPFIAVMKREAGARVIFWCRHHSSGLGPKEIFYNYSKNSVNENMALIARKASAKFGIEYVLHQADGHTLQEIKHSMNNFGLTRGYTIYPLDLKVKSLHEKIMTFLPTIDIATKYLSYFFKVLYPYFPILDEEQFGNDVVRIIINFGRSDVGAVITVEKQLDYATIATLFFVLRMCYVSLFSNLSKGNQELLSTASQFSPLLHNPVPIDVVVTAQECLSKYNLLRRQDINVLQACMFSKYYDTYAPEIVGYYGDTRSHVSNGLVIQLALANGLNRDPDHAEFAMTDRAKNIRRKIWHSIVWLDLLNAITLGTQLTVPKYDTSIPREGIYNIRDQVLEVEVTNSFGIFRSVTSKIHNLLTVMCNVVDVVDTPKFMVMLNKLELTIARVFGRFGDFLNPNSLETESFVIRKISLYLHAKLLLASVYVYFYVHHHDLKNVELEFFYHRKLFALIFCELGDTSKVSIAKNLFGQAFNFIVGPLLNHCNSITTLLAGSMCVRLAVTLTEQPCDAERVALLQNLYQLGLKCANDGFQIIGECGQRYNHAWNLRKSYMSGFTMVFTHIEKDVNSAPIGIASCMYSNQQVGELVTLLKFYLLRSNLYERDSMGARQIVEAFSKFAGKDGSKIPSIMDSLHPSMEDAMIREVQVDNFWCQHYRIQDAPDPDAKNFLVCILKSLLNNIVSTDTVTTPDTAFSTWGDFFGNTTDMFEDPFALKFG